MFPRPAIRRCLRAHPPRPSRASASASLACYCLIFPQTLLSLLKPLATMSVNARVAAYNPLLAVDNPILVAIERNDVRSILQLLAAVPRLASAINDEDPNGQQHSPLHLAAYLGRVEIATLLLDQGANVDPLEVGGDTPLMMAVAKHHVAMVRLLLARGARARVTRTKRERTFSRPRSSFATGRIATLTGTTT
jgi:hypothetical protein